MCVYTCVCKENINQIAKTHPPPLIYLLIRNLISQTFKITSFTNFVYQSGLDIIIIYSVLSYLTYNYNI